MNIDFSKIFPRGKKPPVTICTKRNMILSVDGESRHVPAGEQVTIPHADFSQLEPGDYQLIASNAPKLDVADPTPPRPVPESAPAAWDTLPECFRQFHAAEAEIAVARQHIELIRAKRKEIFGTADIDFDGAEGTILAGSFSAEPRMNPVSTLRPINFDDPVNQKLARFLKVAESNAKEYLARLIETRSFPQQRLFLQCGNYRIEAAEELQSMIDALAEVGFQIFSLRLQALELAEHHVRKLFSGSGVFVRYGSQAPAYLGGLCFAGFEDDGVTMRRYSELPVQTSATYLLRDRERVAELKPLLAAAKKELARAQKASLPVGLPA